ncbi:MAG: RnfABCDGE type electron transport complex subunit D, partial [Spirochaeta sp.]|nr:RnfABCDGE type electron transport complex subunit D [Spirochaeta sp.]
TGLGMWIYGLGAGVLAYLFRHFGGVTGGCAAALLVMNVCVPLINRLTAPRIYGMQRAKGELHG